MARKKKENALDRVKNLVGTAKKTVAQVAKAEKPKQESTFAKSTAKTIGSAAKAGRTAEKIARKKVNEALKDSGRKKSAIRMPEISRTTSTKEITRRGGAHTMKTPVPVKKVSRQEEAKKAARQAASIAQEKAKAKGKFEKTVVKTIDAARKNTGITAGSSHTAKAARQVRDMTQRSDRWAVLQNAKNIAAQNNAGKKQIAQIEAQQQELHKQNVQDAAQLGLEFDADSGEWKQAGQTAYTAKVNPESPETSKEAAAHGRQTVEKPKLLPRTPQEIAAIRAANYEKGAQRAMEIPSKVAGAAKVVGHNTMAGLAGIANAAYSTADFFLPDPITFKPVQDFIDEQKRKTSEIKQQVTAWDYEHGGQIGGFVGSTYQSFVEMLPQAVAALMTSGGSAVASLGSTGGAVAKSVDKIAKSPAYWLSFAQIVGNEYERKKQDGMSDLAAAASAIISATGQAGIEMSGGVETLGKGGLNGLKAAGRTALEEGREEVLQDLFSGLTDEGLYTGEKQVFGTGDSDALINPHRMGSEFAAGALLGGIASGTRGLPGRVVDGVKMLPVFNRAGNAQGGSMTSQADAVPNMPPQVEMLPAFDEQGQRIDRNAQTPQAAVIQPDSQTLGQGQAVQDNQSQQSQPRKVPTLRDHIQNNRELLAKHGVIAEVKGNKFAGSGIKLVDQVHSFFKSIGEKVTRQGFGDVKLTRSGARDSIFHGMGPEKAAAFAVVPDVIQKGQIIDQQHDWKDRRYDTVVFGGRITIDGLPYDMGVIVKKYDDIQRPAKYYLHEVFLVNKEGEATTFQTGTRPNDSVGYPSEVTSPSDVSITQKDLDVNPLDMEKGKNQGAETPGFRQTRQDGIIPLPRFDAQGRRIDNNPAAGENSSAPPSWEVSDASRAKLLQDNPARTEQVRQEMRERLEAKQQINRDADFQRRMNAAQREINPGRAETDWMSDEFLQREAENRAQQNTNPETAQNETIAPRMTEEEFVQAKNRLAELENSFTEADRQAIDSMIRTKSRQALQMADHPQQVQEYYNLWENSADYLAQQIQNAPAMTEEEFAQARNRLAELENSFTEADRQAVNELVHPDQEGQQVLPDHPQQVREYYNLWEHVVNHRIRQDSDARMRRQQADQQLAAEHQTGQNAQSDRMNIFTQTENGVYSPAVRQAVREEIQNIVSDARAHGANVAQHYPLTRSAVGLESSSAEQYVSSANDAVQNATSTEAHALRTTLRRLRDKLHLTPAEVRAAMEYASGRKVEHLTDENAHLRVSAYADVLTEYNQVMRPTYDYWEQTQQARWKTADEFAQHSAEWTDAKRGVALDARTPERVLRKVCGKQADAMIESYIEPVHRHEAQKIKWINERMRQLEKVIKSVSRETGVYTHMKNRADWMERRGRDASQIQVKMAEYAEKHKGKIDFDRVAAIEQGCIEITRAIYPEISEAYIANGYDALEFLENYIPSNGVIHEGGAVAKFLRGAGIETMADELPTEISGTTADRRPGRAYFAAANQRTGYVTEFDLFKAMQNYVVQSADVIFHTGDIQNLRALEERIRYQYSDEATRADLDIADFEYKWDVDKRIQAKSSIWESTFGNLPHFPTWIREYTNLLAGKKLIGDRTTEHDIGRGFFRTINDVEAVAARSMLGGNVSTAISNFIALGQGSAELRTSSIARAMYDYGYDQLKGDTAFRDDSAFLTRRHGVDAAYKTRVQQVNDALFLGMEAVDDISSNVLTRARYYDNMARGMDKTAAMREADAWAASLMGDRSKGSAPLLFQSKSFLRKLVTMFQLEPTNTLGHVFEDMPYEARQRGKVWLAKTLTELALMSFLMNDLWEKTTGRRPVQDPVGIVNEFVGKITGWCMPNTFDLLGWAMTGERDKEELGDLFRTQKKDTGDAITETAQDAAGYIPIVGGMIGGAVGAKTSRFPMESIIPNVKELVGTLNHSGTPESRRATRLEELSKPVIGLIPGGSQMRKTYKGTKMLHEGGQYGFSPQGERILKFPAYGQKPGAAEKAFTASQALLFGPTATARGQKYVRSGFVSLSADKTQIYERLVSGGMDGGKAFDTLLKMSGKMAENYENLVTKGEIDEDAARKAVWAVEKAEAKKGSGLSNKQAKREAIMALDLDWMEKSIVDKWLIGGGESGGGDYDSSRYSSKEIFEVTNYVKKNRVQDALRMVREYALDTRQAKKYAEIYDETDEEIYNPETKKRESIGKAQRLKTVLDQINSADDLDDKQKDGVKKILLLPELGEKYASDQAKGYIDGISIDQLIDAENAYQTISDEVKADLTIHEKNRSEMTRVRFTQYLESTGMTRAQQDGLYYFRANGTTDLSKPWSEIIRLGDDDVQAAAPGLEMSGMNAEQYKVVKAGMDRIYADKDSKGESVDGSKKKKLIAYLSQWDLTDEQKDLLMRADGYKYGMGEKPKNSGRGSGKGGRKSGGGSKGGGRKTPPTLPTLPTFKTPF